MINLFRKVADRLTKKESIDVSKLTRAQRRAIQRYQAEAHTYCNSLCSNFLSYLYDADPSNLYEIEAKIKHLNSRWIFYCKTKGLAKSVENLVLNFCNDTLKKFKDSYK